MQNRRVFVPLALLVAAALACVVPGFPASPTLYKDNFTNPNTGWCVENGKSSALSYSGGEYVIKVLDKNWLVWCNPGQNFSNIHVEVTAKNVGHTTDTIFGVVCNYQKPAKQATGNFYYLGFSPDGQYRIYLSQGDKDTLLKKGTSSTITSNAISYTVGADCGGTGQLVLYADGKQIANATDTTISNGDVGLFAWTGENAPAEIHYDNIVVTQLSSVTPTP